MGEKLLTELTKNTVKTKQELQETRKEMLILHKKQISNPSSSPSPHEQESIEFLSEKFKKLQNDVVDFESKERKTLMDMEKSIRQLEELTAMRFDVLESVHATRLPEAAKLEKLSAQEERKAAALVVELKDVETQVTRTKDRLNAARVQ